MSSACSITCTSSGRTSWDTPWARGSSFKLLADHPDRLISAMPCGIGLQPQTAEERELLRGEGQCP